MELRVNDEQTSLQTSHMSALYAFTAAPINTVCEAQSTNDALLIYGEVTRVLWLWNIVSERCSGKRQYQVVEYFYTFCCDR